MVERLFLGLDKSSRDKMIDYPHVLISAAALWNGKRFRCTEVNPAVEEIFLDSGGFSFFTKWAKYPFTVEEYLIFVRQFCSDHPETRYVAVMDYPCEEFVNREGFRTNRERIDATLANTKTLIEREIPAEWVSVVQGHDYDEYQYCCAEMRKRGLWTPLTAIGSICTRTSLFEIKYILRMIKKYHAHLHTFGLSLRALQNREIWNPIYSSDTGAWRLCSNKCGNDWKPRGNEEIMESYRRYKEKIETLFEMRNGNQIFHGMPEGGTNP